MPAARPRRSSGGEEGARRGPREGGGQAAAHEEAGQAQAEQAEEVPAEGRRLSRSEQAALRRKLQEKFH